jgi:hypothetical protein
MQPSSPPRNEEQDIKKLMRVCVWKKRGRRSWYALLLTPWSRVLLEKLTVNFTASQEIPRIYGTRKFLTLPTSGYALLPMSKDKFPFIPPRLSTRYACGIPLLVRPALLHNLRWMAEGKTAAADKSRCCRHDGRKVYCKVAWSISSTPSSDNRVE